GILNNWIKKIAGGNLNYSQMNEAAKTIAPGSDGLMMLPFGNGAERMLENKTVDAHILQINLNQHTQAHLFRAAQEGIAFAFRWGLDILRENGVSPTIIRAGKANMFLSDVFTQAFVDTTQTAVELFETDGSVGAAIGAAMGMGIYESAREAFQHKEPLALIEPKQQSVYEHLYQEWKSCLITQLNKQ
ncbi:MAG: carbohydrate kinase, partial [Chitinophagaceae bacterium]|nr:carbohydrate kinase [Chitinophagaceae bacterium]